MSYFNYAATTPINEDVLDTYLNVSRQFYQYPELNQDCSDLLEQGRETMLSLLDASDKLFIFTSGGSEANNLAIKGYASTFKEKKHFITSIYEHASVYESFKVLEDEGHKVTYLNPNLDGQITLDMIEQAITKETVLISIMHVNNELGSINDIETMYQVIKSNYPQIKLMTDNVQGIGKLNNLDLSNVDMMTISSHKVYGPKAIGGLVLNKNITLKPIISGGQLEHNMRGGMQSLGGQIAFVKAFKLSIDNQVENINKVDDIRKELLSYLNQDDFYTVNALPKTNVISIACNTIMQGESIVTFFKQHDIEISTKSACSTKSDKKNRVLDAIKLTDHQIARTIRISFSHLTTREDLNNLIDVLNLLKNK